MTDPNKILSLDRKHLARLQRQRREKIVRIDYMPSDSALKIMAAKRGRYYPLNTNSGILDAILTEWAVLTGSDAIVLANARELGRQSTHARMQPKSERRAKAHEIGRVSGIFTGIARVRMRAYEFDNPAQKFTEQNAADRVLCGAQRHRDGRPCQAKPEPGKRRCRFHGGRSTGPRTSKGKARALANLRRRPAAVGKEQPN